MEMILDPLMEYCLTGLARIDMIGMYQVINDESTVTEYSGGGGRKRRDPNFEDVGSKIVSTSSAIDLVIL
ncbi:hypothetical protein HanRHA438_Chr02g0060631 [Helianthus annuus]|nr:hypothetical protein HanRHA438_Chr02g0060631 [Helianthus annuus]